MFRNTRAKLQFSKLFHNGIQVAPFVDFTTEGSNFKGKQRKAEFGGKGINDLYTTRVGSDFLLPLLRGRGSDAIAAGERAATVEAQAGTLDVEHQRASSILRTAQAYWELRAAQESLAILERSVTRQGDLLRATTSLVNGGELARVELARSQAGEARARARVLDARQRLYDARVELADALGVASSGADATLPTAAKDPFPVAPDAAALQPWVGATAARRPAPRRRSGDAPRGSRRHPAARRGDRPALAARPVGVAVLHGARRSRRRRHGGPGRRTAAPSTAATASSRRYDRWVGPSFTLTLNYEKPLGNNTAKGRLAAREAERRTRAIETGDLRRLVRLNVGRTATALIETIGRLKQTQAASQVLRPDDHRGAGPLPRRRGDADQHDHRPSSRRPRPTSRLIAAQQAVANLLAQLRFESGTLVTNSTVSAPTLVSLPTAAGSAR